jgi:hypothetical protein
MCRLIVPPVDGWQAGMKLHSVGLENPLRAAQKLVGMLQQHTAVPLQEEATVLAAPAALVVEEACLVGPLAVTAGIVRATVSPMRLAHLLCCCRQRRYHEAVVTLQCKTPHTMKLS